MREAMNYRDEFAVDMAAAELRDIVEQAGFGLCSWSEVAEFLHDAFPGHMAFALNHSISRPHLNFHAFPGLDQRQVDEYFSHYAALNPWVPSWVKRAVGTVSRSEADDPIRLRNHTEFYNDWLNRGVDADAAVGIKVGSTNDEVCYLGVHYSARNDAIFGPALVRMLGGLQQHFVRAVELNHRVATAAELAASSAALLDRRQDIALVIDSGCRVVDMNPVASDCLARAGAVRQVRGVLQIGDRRTSEWLSKFVERSYLYGDPAPGERFFESDRQLWRVAVSPLPNRPEMRVGGLFSMKRLFLVSLRTLVGPSVANPSGSLKAHFSLTTREWTLCLELLEGYDIQEVGERLGVTKETVRQQLKSVFRKTGVNRQSTLIALLTRGST